MARKDLVKNKFPEDSREELLAILETFGGVADTVALADYFGTTKMAVKAFLQSKEARAAVARYVPGSRELVKKRFADFTSAEPSWEPVAPSSQEGLDQIEEAVPEGVISAFNLMQDRKRE